MDKWEAYWLSIAKDIKEYYGQGHPAKWEESSIEAFLSHFENSVKEIIAKDEELAKNCGVKYKGISLEQWGTMVPSTFRRIFSYRTNTGKRSTRNSFAIYLGYRSAEDYLSKKGMNEVSTLDRELPLVNSKDNQKWNKRSLDISNKFLSKCLELGLDAALASEAKRVINTQLEIDKADHHMTVDGTTVHLRAVYKGRNIGHEEKEYFHFNPVSAVPCYPDDMQTYARDLSSGKQLSIFTKDDDLSNSKNYKLLYSKPIKRNERFHIEFGYRLISTAKLIGKDYLMSILTFEERLDSYNLKITFHDKFPESIKLINAYEEFETTLMPKYEGNTAKFSYQLSQKDIKSLNNLRLLILYERL